MSQQLSRRREERFALLERYLRVLHGEPTHEPDQVPDADADDAKNGASFIPNKVSVLRGLGYTVEFVHDDRGRYHWVLPGGEKVFF